MAGKRLQTNKKQWKSYQKKQKTRRWVKKLGITLGASLALGLLLGALRFGWWLNEPLKQAQFGRVPAPNWQKDEQLNLLIVTENAKCAPCRRFYLTSLDPWAGTLKVVSFADSLKVLTLGKPYLLSELFDLGRVQNPPQGVDFLMDNLKKDLAVPIDGYVLLSSSTFPSANLKETAARYHQTLQFPGVALKVPWMIKFMRSNTKTNLTAGQILKLLWEIQRVRFDKVRVFQFDRFASVSEQDIFTRQIFQSPAMMAERLKVSVKNASGWSGLAAQAARYIENLGVEVIEVQNSKLELQTSQILVYSVATDSLTVRRLESIFGVKAEWIETHKPQRADVEVVVVK